MMISIILTAVRSVKKNAMMIMASANSRIVNFCFSVIDLFFTKLSKCFL